jgi:hypothetical protein
MSELMNAEIEGKKTFTLPEGATIIKKSTNIRVREIENGFLISKSYDIQWTPKDGDDTKYDYITKEWYQKENPVQINMPKDKSLADKLD